MIELEMTLTEESTFNETFSAKDSHCTLSNLFRWTEEAKL